MNKENLKATRAKLENALEQKDQENNRLIEAQEQLEKHLNTIRANRRKIQIEQGKLRRAIKKITDTLIK